VVSHHPSGWYNAASAVTTSVASTAPPSRALLRVWSACALDVASSYGWTELVTCPQGNPTRVPTSKLARAVAAELKAAGWRLERVLTDG
jgi:hypothetical protein